MCWTRSRALLLALLPACRPPPVPGGDGGPVTFQLSGHLEPGQPGLPFEGGAELLGEDCAEAARLTGGHPPPCAAERWRSPGGAETVDFVRAGERGWLRDELGVRAAAAQWDGLRGSLALCLGDPLALPPAGEESAYRLLLREGGSREPRYRWLLHFGGRPCGLSGELRLDALGSGLDLHALSVEGLPWDQGGREHLDQRLLAWDRARLPLDWPGLDRAQRVLALRRLARDPSPDAGSLLRRLLREHPGDAPDIRAALARREAAGLPVPPEEP